MYQAEEWIRETLASVAAQTYPRVETIVVDDGSTDRGTDLVVQYQESRIHAVQFIRTENHGVSEARNIGIRASTGDYIALLDADDLWYPRKLELQVAYLENVGGSACVCGYDLFDDATGRQKGVVRFREGSTALLKWLALEGNGLLIPSTAVIRRTVIDDIRGFDPEFSVSADLNFALCLEQLDPIIALPEVLARYRVHPAQMHRKLGAFESDMSQVYDRVFLGNAHGSFERRCRANLDAHIGYSALLKGHLRTGLWHLASSSRLDWRRPVTLPFHALSRHFGRHWRAWLTRRFSHRGP
jgi:glycosyltransferase involved in cell wall biosynthesis